MMGNLNRILAATLALAVTPYVGAQAGGDFRFPPEPVVAFPSATPIAEYPAWYVRGDIAWGFDADFDLSQANAVITNPGDSNVFTLGGGFGYFFTDTIRGDVTVDHRFSAPVTGTNVTTGAPVNIDLASTVVLGNLYYDFRGRDAFSPYVGAGLGITSNQADSKDSLRTDLGAAAMAGVTYRMRDNMSFDAGYRLLYLGEARTDAAVPTSIEDIYAHELRIGVRYEFQ